MLCTAACIGKGMRSQSMSELVSESPSASVTAEQKASGASTTSVTSTSRRALRSTLPPGPEGVPFAGNLFQFRANPLNFVTSVARSYGEVATLHMGAQPLILFSRPEHVRYFLTQQPRNFTNREFARNLTACSAMVFSPPTATSTASSAASSSLLSTKSAWIAMPTSWFSTPVRCSTPGRQARSAISHARCRI